MSDPIRITDVKTQWVLTVDDGKQLELLSASSQTPCPIAAIFADEEEQLFFEIYTDGNRVQLPVEQIQKAFDLARGEVHSEKWFEENVYPKNDGT